MGLLDHLETQLGRQIPAQLQAALQQALDDYQSLCGQCRRMAGGMTLLGRVTKLRIWRYNGSAKQCPTGGVFSTRAGIGFLAPPRTQTQQCQRTTQYPHLCFVGIFSTRW